MAGPTRMANMSWLGDINETPMPDARMRTPPPPPRAGQNAWLLGQASIYPSVTNPTVVTWAPPYISDILKHAALARNADA